MVGINIILSCGKEYVKFAWEFICKPGWEKKASCHTDDSNEDLFLFGSLICMMLHQSRIESEQRDCQNKQRERQHKIDAELREHKFQICHKEMAIACNEAHAQGQLLNVMMMTLLN
jgi:hypothetical protein